MWKIVRLGSNGPPTGNGVMQIKWSHVEIQDGGLAEFALSGCFIVINAT